MTGCNLDIDESSTELKRKDNDGKEVSYNPPRYEYSYDFYITILSTTPISTKCASRSTPAPWTLRRRLERVLA